MEWQATDQFGNLYVGESPAQSVEELRPHLAMLVEALRERAGNTFRITVDFDYQEVSGPDPDQVAYVLRVPWLATVDPATTFSELAIVVAALCGETGLSEVTFETA